MSAALQSTEAQRLRQVEFERRIFPILLVVAGVMWAGLGLLALSHPLDDVLITAAVGTVYFGFLFYSQRRAVRSTSPLVWLALQELGVILLLGSAITWSGGVHSAALPITVIVALIIGVRFPTRWVIAQIPVYAILILACIWVGDADELTAGPVEGLAWLSAFVMAAIVTNMLAHAERNARRDAVHDALTGLLNRQALTERLEQAHPPPEPARRDAQRDRRGPRRAEGRQRQLRPRGRRRGAARRRVGPRVQHPRGRPALPPRRRRVPRAPARDPDERGR
ncbi:GGDEF domain-containing protein [Svornostia abyssi]|uniref:GGDEF domain-containing protein n=1 Tax=Svornostia abyssi TaxID=2898438 RepID=A0ABY5PM75_9ACTN|nr:GGDEF domain-containing protein [Parviterribacteraceae bacterium J379]